MLEWPIRAERDRPLVCSQVGGLPDRHDRESIAAGRRHGVLGQIKEVEE